MYVTFRKFMNSVTHTHLFYSPLDFFWNYPGEPVPEQIWILLKQEQSYKTPHWTHHTFNTSRALDVSHYTTVLVVVWRWPKWDWRHHRVSVRVSRV